MINTSWSDVEAAIVADWHAGFRLREVAARSGWSPPVVSRVLRQHGINPRGRPQLCGKSPAWSDGEFAAVLFARGPTDALERHRARFPDSDRTPTAIRKMYNKAKREGEAFHGLARLQEGLV